MSGGRGPLFAGLRDRLSERFFPPPLDTVEALERFVGQRAAYVAQTSLYGYLKTRMGTSFPRYFEDETFSVSIKAAAVRLFASCTADLTVYVVAVAGRDGRLGEGACEPLARHCFAAALRAGLEPTEAALVLADATEAFAARAARTVWASAAVGEAAFAGSVEDLIRYAPVIDEFKDLDRPIVRNAMRFHWRDIRTQLERRLEPHAVSADWHARF